MIDLSELSPEQLAIVNHPITVHARVLAGPGTGKSFTATQLLGKLHSPGSTGIRSKMLTFTRAATAEFAAKMVEHGLDGVIDEPSTVHSHALSILLKTPSRQLPTPLRIPDSWETKELIRVHLSQLLRAVGQDSATPSIVKVLELEMAAGWETLNDEIETISDATPQLKSDYLVTWAAHREAFGYSLLAELPFRAAIVLKNMGLQNPLAIDLLIVDEYQDLNAADVRLIKTHAESGVSILAIGDDDQSIYSWRQADPEGIIRFPSEFTPSADYTLSISHRCGTKILNIANELISATPGRRQKIPLSSPANAPTGFFAYVQFPNDAEEAKCVAAMVLERLASGIDPSQILILVRSRADLWRKMLQTPFDNANLVLSSTDWVSIAIQDSKLRAFIALLRLNDNPEDSLAWWALAAFLTPGVGSAFTNYVYENLRPSESWGKTLLRLHSLGFPKLAASYSRKVSTTISQTLQRLSTLEGDLKTWREDNQGSPWVEWLLAEAAASKWDNNLLGTELSPDAVALLNLFASDQDSGDSQKLGDFLNQLEVLGKEKALEVGGIRLMSISQSKGLTVDTCIILGVEEPIIPFGTSTQPNEERRLLYVALTRAKKVCIATKSLHRSGSIAMSGGGTARLARDASSLMVGLSYGPPISEHKCMVDLKEYENT